MHNNSALLFKKYAAKYFKSQMKILEIGPDGVPSTYQKIINDTTHCWESLDMVATHQKVTHLSSSEYQFGLPDDSYDVVLAGQVIEHVKKIWVWIREVARVCKPGGYVVIIAPVSWPYHEAPVDCWRIYPEGMKALFDEAGLDVVTSRCESLEPESASRKNYPGATDGTGPFKRAIKKLIGWPLSTPLDTITIGVKEQQTRAESIR